LQVGVLGDDVPERPREVGRIAGAGLEVTSDHRHAGGVLERLVDELLARAEVVPDEAVRDAGLRRD
jgi:hypothetical protein